jgi:hypothetical protein
MTRETSKKIREVLFYSLPRTFLDRIDSNMRAIQFECTDNLAIIHCYFDGEISEENLENMDEAETELIADFHTAIARIECIRVDMPNPIIGNSSSEWFYMRKEKSRASENQDRQIAIIKI